MEPIAFVNSLVKGVILAFYDFVRLTWIGLAIPFVTGTRKFWPNSISATRRLSSLTYLTIWILLSVAIASRTSSKVASSAIGLDKSSDSAITLGVTLLFAIFIDVPIRLGCSLFHSPIRRQLYEDLARIAVGNICFAACLIMVVEPMVKKPDLLVTLLGPIVLLGNPLRWLPHPALVRFSGSLAIITLKAWQRTSTATLDPGRSALRVE
jgi:hypothetical protein